MIEKLNEIYSIIYEKYKYIYKQEYLQEEIEKYIIILWSKYHNKKCDLSSVIEIENINDNFINDIDYDNLLFFISPQTETIKIN